MNQDCVIIEGLALDLVIGIYPWERQQPQRVLVNLTMAMDHTQAARTDCIDDAMDYEAVVKHLKHLSDGTQFNLLETLGRTLIDGLVTTYAPDQLTMQLMKHGVVPDTQACGIRMHYQRPNPSQDQHAG